MTSSSPITLLLAAATHAACLTVALLSGPSNESFGLLFLVWASVPATLSAMGFAPLWQSAINGLMAALIVDTLLLGFSYFWPLQPRETQLYLALAYLLVFPAIATICGVFVKIIIHAIENTPSQPPYIVGARKGGTFAGICGLAGLPVLILFLSAYNGRAMADNRLLLVSVTCLAGAILIGTIIGGITGCSYQLRPQQTQER